MPVPRHGAQICARAPTKGCVQTGARDRASSLNGALYKFPQNRVILQTSIPGYDNQNR